MSKKESMGATNTHTNSDCILDVVYEVLALFEIFGILKTVLLASQRITRSASVLIDAQFLFEGFKLRSLGLLLGLFTSRLTLNVIR